MGGSPYAFRPSVLVLYITTTPTQTQAPNPKKVWAAFQPQARIQQPGVTMNSKVLIIMGIVVAHGALAAGWVQQEAPQHRTPKVVAACSPSPDVLPDFTPRAMRLAALVSPEPLGESMQP